MNKNINKEYDESTKIDGMTVNYSVEDNFYVCHVVECNQHFSSPLDKGLDEVKRRTQLLSQSWKRFLQYT